MLNFLVYLLSGLFGIGILGCLLVIPITAYRLFGVLFEKDQPGEDNPSRQSSV
jgi:hypothetical protein